MSLKFKVAAVIPATPQQVYDVWLDSDVPSRMTGSRPARTSTKGGRVSSVGLLYQGLERRARAVWTHCPIVAHHSFRTIGRQLVNRGQVRES